MADSDVIAFIMDDAMRRGVPFVLSAGGRVRAYALPPEYELARYTHPPETTPATLREMLGWPEPEKS
jgi:hypothetical protein